MQNAKISLVIPVRDEAMTIEALFESIARQTLAPDEVIIVDGGSTDATVEILERQRLPATEIRVIRTDGATPGRGRNLGIEAARNEWIALTDAGIKLADDWLEQLWKKAGDPACGLVQGNYSPVTDTYFTKCAAVVYVPSFRQGNVRGPFIASSLVRKGAWADAGGFPDLRAAEDLIFLENIGKTRFSTETAPAAMIRWQLRPDLGSTFRKFVLYSKHNVLAGRHWDWHYGLLRQYALLLPFILLAVFHSVWWLAALPLWLLLRSLRRTLPHAEEYGRAWVLNPLNIAAIAGILLVVDAATFTGWVRAAATPKASGERTSAETDV
jgi:glycosyltransferase involved in cell wall biosynthesis